MKRIDRLLITSFIPPFIVTFGIAMFVLLMQVLWLYLDDIAGKGLGFFLIMELLAYKCVGLVPLALPLAILISSVMVVGGLAEHYELSSFKSAGVSLIRVMRPIIFFGFLGAIFSYLCSDFIIPAANLKFGSRMFDIQQKKPALSMEAGIFNNDFANYAIHIGSKAGDGRSIEDVLIYDHGRVSGGELSQIVADKGEMYATPDGNYFIMQLRDGYQYSEKLQAGGRGRSATHPFVRTAFATWTKVFDLSEFNLARTNPKLFETNRSMLTTWELQEASDTIELDIARRKQMLSNHLASYLRMLEPDTTELGSPQEAELQRVNEKYRLERRRRDSLRTDSLLQDSLYREKLRIDSLQRAGVPIDTSRRQSLPPQPRPQPQPLEPRPATATTNYPVGANIVRQSATRSGQSPVRRAQEDQAPLLALPDPADWTSIDSLLAQLSLTRSTRIYNRARAAARSVQSQASSAMRNLDNMRENRAKHLYDMHMKFSMAVVCIIFVFVGAPMGAIVRKGGFGYPILVSIIAFVFFIILTIFCRKIAESFVVTGVVAGWLPCAILFPIGLWLTRQAMNDSKLFSADRIRQWWLRIRKRQKNQQLGSEISRPAS